MDCSLSLPRVLVIGKESVGKSQLVASLTGRWAASYNFPGSTVACDCYADEFYNYIDSPGLLRHSDSTACRETLAALAENERVLLVVNATHIDQDLEDLLGWSSATCCFSCSTSANIDLTRSGTSNGATFNSRATSRTAPRRSA